MIHQDIHSLMVKCDGSRSESILIISRLLSPSERNRNGTRYDMRLVDSHAYPKTPNLIPDSDSSSRRKDRRRDKSKHGDTGVSGGGHSSRQRVPAKSKCGPLRVRKRDLENSGQDPNNQKNVTGGTNKNNTVENDDSDDDNNNNDKVNSFNVDELGSRATARPVAVADNSKTSICKMRELLLSSENCDCGAASPFQMIPAIPRTREKI